MIYAFSENFILPLSHDEVVHGKGSLLDKMPGDRWQQFANLRALYAYHVGASRARSCSSWAASSAQEREWNHDGSLDWHLLEHAEHAGVQALVRDLNRVYRDEPALWEVDFEPARLPLARGATTPRTTSSRSPASAPRARRRSSASLNLSPVPREGYRVGLPVSGAGARC